MYYRLAKYQINILKTYCNIYLFFSFYIVRPGPIGLFVVEVQIGLRYYKKYISRLLF